MNKLPYIIVLVGIILTGAFVLYEEQQNFSGTTIAVFQGGTGTTTLPVSQIPYGGSGNVYQSRATTTVTCVGNATCSTFDVLGSSPVTLTGTGLSGYDSWSHGTQWGQVYSGTSTLIWLQGTPFSLVASSTSIFDYATSTAFSSKAIFFTGLAPTLGACGTATITATSTDARGTINVTSGTPTTCNITFSSAKSDTPTCVVSTNSVTLLSDVAQASTTGVQFGLSAVFTGRIHYICLQ